MKTQVFSNAGDNVTIVFPSDIEEIFVIPMATVATHVLVLGNSKPTAKQWTAILDLFERIFLHGEAVRKFSGWHEKVVYVESARNLESTVAQYCATRREEIVVSVHEPLEQLILSM